MDKAEIDLKDIIAILKRQRRLIAMTVVLCLALALAYILTATPIYRASSLLLVDSRGTNLLDPSSGEQQSAVINSRVDSEVEIIRSEATALAVIEAGNLLADPEFGPQLGWWEKLGIVLGIDNSGIRRMLGMSPRGEVDPDRLLKSGINKLRSAVTVRRQGLTYLISISVDSARPETAARLANLYADTYIRRQIAAKSAALLNARDVLRRQLRDAQEQLVRAETAVNGYIESNLAQLERESGNPAIAELRRNLEGAKARQGALQGQLARAESALTLGNWEEAATSLGNEAMAELARQRRELERRLGAASAGSEDAINLAAELEKIDAELKAQRDTTLGAIRNDLAVHTDLEAATRDKLRDTLLQSGLSAQMLTELFNLQQTATNARNQYQTLLAREQDAGTLASLQVADARVVSEALPPSSASAPKKNMILGMALVGGLFFGIALAFLKEYYIGGIVSASQLQNVLQLRVPVTIPQLSHADGESPSNIVIASPMSPYAETFRKLRAAIDMRLFERPGDQGRVVLISSALQAEGKTTTAIALARTYAQAGLRTLLIDADLRKPAVAERLDLGDEPGLLDYLSHWGSDRSAELKVLRDPLSPLMVVTAGGRSSTPTDQLMNSPAFRALMQETRKVFDMVIIDSPPLLPVVDTRYLARHADAIVMVVRYSTTTQGEAREAATQLAEMKPAETPLYAVLSHEERTSSGYGRYYNYSYYGYGGERS